MSTEIPFQKFCLPVFYISCNPCLSIKKNGIECKYEFTSVLDLFMYNK